MTPCPTCDQASVVDETGCCIHCGTYRGRLVAVALLVDVRPNETDETVLAFLDGPRVIHSELHPDPDAIFDVGDDAVRSAIAEWAGFDVVEVADRRNGCVAFTPSGTDRSRCRGCGRTEDEHTAPEVTR